MALPLAITCLPDTYFVAQWLPGQLPAEDMVRLNDSSRFMSITVTPDEISGVMTSAALTQVSRPAKQEGPFALLKVEGVLDFSLTGILSCLLQPLAKATIPVFTLSTYNTDYILVPSDNASTAMQVLGEVDGVTLSP